MMVNLPYFERLTETVTLLVRHPEYPSKGEVLERCRHEVTELIRAGRLSVAQAEMLYTILDGDCEPGPEGRREVRSRGRSHADHHGKAEGRVCAAGTLPPRRG